MVNQHDQLPREMAETYIVELYRLVEHCNGNVKDEIIHDHLVVGILDK